MVVKVKGTSAVQALLASDSNDISTEDAANILDMLKEEVDAEDDDEGMIRAAVTGNVGGSLNGYSNQASIGSSSIKVSAASPSHTFSFSPLLDVYGVIPSPGRWFVLHGQRGTGKTAACVEMARMLIFQNYLFPDIDHRAVYFDTEGGLDTNRTSALTSPSALYPLRPGDFNKYTKVYSPYTCQGSHKLSVIQAKILEELGATSEEVKDIEESGVDDDGDPRDKPKTIAALIAMVKRVVKKHKGKIPRVIFTIDSFAGIHDGDDLAMLDKSAAFISAKYKLIGTMFKQLQYVLYAMNASVVLIDWDMTNVNKANIYSPDTTHGGASSTKFMGNHIVGMSFRKSDDIVRVVDKEKELAGRIVRMAVEKSRNARNVVLPTQYMFNVGFSKTLTFMNYINVHWDTGYRELIVEALREPMSKFGVDLPAMVGGVKGDFKNKLVKAFIQAATNNAKALSAARASGGDDLPYMVLTHELYLEMLGVLEYIAGNVEAAVYTDELCLS